MLINIIHEQYPNRDSKQCTESKLGWVHQVHTLNPSYAHRPSTQRPLSAVSWRVEHRIFAPSRLCRMHILSCCRAHARAVASCRNSPVTIQGLYRNTSPTFPAVSQRSCAVSLGAVSQLWLCYIATQPAAKPSSCHDTRFVS